MKYSFYVASWSSSWVREAINISHRTIEKFATTWICGSFCFADQRYNTTRDFAWDWNPSASCSPSFITTNRAFNNLDSSILFIDFAVSVTPLWGTRTRRRRQTHESCWFDLPRQSCLTIISVRFAYYRQVHFDFQLNFEIVFTDASQASPICETTATECNVPVDR